VLTSVPSVSMVRSVCGGADARRLPVPGESWVVGALLERRRARPIDFNRRMYDSTQQKSLVLCCDGVFRTVNPFPMVLG